MSQRRTRGNTNPRRATNVLPPVASLPNKDLPQPAIGTPNSMTIAAAVTAIPTNPTVANSLGSSNLILDSIDSSSLEDFGKDKDMKNLLKTL